ncbi:EAL domain-containing protein [Microvirga sp. 2TAF3]|uniref:EAL domain-containing protein n=1 Tax=Microvirga sp. 2TAF3 TaxID=3233014 RepID=UPI003F99B49C
MTRKRQGRAGIFKGAAQARHSRTMPVDPPSALAALQGVVYDWDIASDTLSWGPNASELLGIAPDSLPRTGAAFAHLIEPGSGLLDRNRIFTDEASETTYDLRYALRFGPDHVTMVQDMGRRRPDGRRGPGSVRGLLRADRAARDLLPGAIKTRSALLLRLNDDIAEALRFSHTVTLILGSVDSEDDADAMEEVARLVRPMMRRRDHFTILAPNRFALALTSCLAWDAMSAMKRLAGLVASRPLQVHLGAACAPDHAFEATGLLRLAEQALETAAAGPEKAVLHDPRKTHARPASATADPLDIVRALNERRLTLALQPVVDARTREPALAQACLSLPSTQGGPDTLGAVPVFDEADLSLLVDGRMLELSADHLARHADSRIILPIAPATFKDDEWLTMLAAHLGARPGIESRLMIEIPEAILSDPGATRGRLDAMKALGIGTVLSGFGSGYASFAHLRNLPIDLIKIDGIFIQSLKRSTDDRLFVHRLIDIALHLGIATAADWVDDEPTAQKLAEWGVDYLQGGLPGEAEPVPLPRLMPQRAKRA